METIKPWVKQVIKLPREYKIIYYAAYKVHFNATELGKRTKSYVGCALRLKVFRKSYTWMHKAGGGAETLLLPSL